MVVDDISFYHQSAYFVRLVADGASLVGIMTTVILIRSTNEWVNPS